MKGARTSAPARKRQSKASVGKAGKEASVGAACRTAGSCALGGGRGTKWRLERGWHLLVFFQPGKWHDFWVLGSATVRKGVTEESFEGWEGSLFSLFSSPSLFLYFRLADLYSPILQPLGRLSKDTLMYMLGPFRRWFSSPAGLRRRLAFAPTTCIALHAQVHRCQRTGACRPVTG